MRVARLFGPGDLRLADEPDPIPGPDDELVRVTAVGLCGSDRHWFIDGAIGGATLGRPLVLGHEIAGVVESGSRRGLRVAVDPADPCERCELCRTDRSHLCPATRFAGYEPTDGGLRTLMRWPARLLCPVPDSISDAEAALLEPLGVAVHAMDLARVEPGMRVGVFGCGPIGLLFVQLVAAAGCEAIVAVEPLAHRRVAALAAGATIAADPGAEHAMPEPSSLDLAIEVSGEDEALAAAMDAVKPGARIVLVGIPSPDRTTFPASVARRKELTIQLSRRMAATDLARATALAATGAVRLGMLVTDRHPLEDAQEAFSCLVERRGIKIVVEPWAAAGPSRTVSSPS